MALYLLRRLLYGVLVLFGVNLLTFLLFFAVNTPDDMARLNLGGKHVTAEAIEAWKSAHDLQDPLFWNPQASGLEKATRTIFFKKSLPLLALEFGESDSGRDIASEIRTRMWPSLALALPTFLLGLAVVLGAAVLLVLVRGSRAERAGLAAAVLLMSISSLFFIILSQWLFAKVLRWFPVSGYAEGARSIVFLLLPIAAGILSRLGSDTLLFRAMLLEEAGKDYVRTARAKGLSEMRVLFRHVLRNALLPISTATIALIPMLFMGSLVMESFFGIPGLGSYTIDALNAQDFSVVRVLVFLGTAAYIIGLVATDMVYAWADPRIRFE